MSKVLRPIQGAEKGVSDDTQATVESGSSNNNGSYKSNQGAVASVEARGQYRAENSGSILYSSDDPRLRMKSAQWRSERAELQDDIVKYGMDYQRHINNAGYYLGFTSLYDDLHTSRFDVKSNLEQYGIRDRSSVVLSDMQRRLEKALPEARGKFAEEMMAGIDSYNLGVEKMDALASNYPSRAVHMDKDAYNKQGLNQATLDVKDLYEYRIQYSDAEMNGRQPYEPSLTMDKDVLLQYVKDAEAVASLHAEEDHLDYDESVYLGPNIDAYESEESYTRAMQQHYNDFSRGVKAAIPGESPKPLGRLSDDKSTEEKVDDGHVRSSRIKDAVTHFGDVVGGLDDGSSHDVEY